VRPDLAQESDVMFALERLTRIYPKLDVSEGAIEEWVGVMQRGLVRFDCLQTAVDRYLDAENNYQPKPSSIRNLAKAAEAELKAAEQQERDRPAGAEHVCTSCGSPFRFAGLEVGPKRVLVPALRCGCQDARTGWRRDLDPWPEKLPAPGGGRAA
jgi:hypothetical protein